MMAGTSTVPTIRAGGAATDCVAALRRRLSLLLLTLLGVATAAVGDANCAVIEDKPVARGRRIGLRFDPGSIAPARVEAAVGLWRQCRNFGSGFPEIVGAGAADRLVVVEHRPSEAGPGRCGSFVGSRIVLWGSQRQPDGTVRPCGALEQNLAHELGHVLGLVDAPRGGTCSRRIMARLHRGNLGSRRVQPDECMAVGQLWLTPVEMGRMAAAPSVRRVTSR